MGGSIGALSENCRADTKTALNWWQSVRPSGFRPRNESEDIRDGTERLSMADESDKRVIVGRRGRQVNSVQLDAVNWAEHPEDVEDGNHLGGVWGEGGGGQRKVARTGPRDAGGRYRCSPCTLKVKSRNINEANFSRRQHILFQVSSIRTILARVNEGWETRRGGDMRWLETRRGERRSLPSCEDLA